MNFSQTTQGFGFIVSYVGGFLYNPAATGRFDFEPRTRGKTTTGLEIPLQLVR
ncbi:hypothetical protein [Gimesia aquarii]|nr:hypothetical protein [Gimesia aquarii]